MAASKAWCLVSPASRGIGLALTRHLLRTTNVPVVATARKDVPGYWEKFDADTFVQGLEDPEGARKRLHVLTVNVRSKCLISYIVDTLCHPLGFRHASSWYYIHSS